MCARYSASGISLSIIMRKPSRLPIVIEASLERFQVSLFLFVPLLFHLFLLFLYHVGQLNLRQQHLIRILAKSNPRLALRYRNCLLVQPVVSSPLTSVIRLVEHQLSVRPLGYEQSVT